MSQQELLTRVVTALNKAGIAYMLTGSVVSSFQGEPRLTHDIDLIVSLENFDASSLIKAFPPPDYYLDEQDIATAVREKRMFNLIETTSGDKVDFWMITDEPYDAVRFARRYTENVIGADICLSSPEDTIIAKLRWAQLCGGSEKQFNDALRVYEVQHGRLDLTYIERWVNTLDLSPLWQRLLREAEVT